MERGAAIWLVVTLALVGTGVSAMGIRTSKRVLARSADGAVLREIREDGPEGGGSLSYRIDGKRRGDVVQFKVSSDFSPGGNSQPQLVSSKECEQLVAALGAELGKRKFRGVTLHPERCAHEDREGLVVAQ